MRFTSSYVIWAMANPPGLIRAFRLRGFLQGMRNAGKFDALDARNGYALLEKLRLNAASQFAGHFILARRSGSYLQTNRGSISVKILNAEDARTIHERLRPCGITSQCCSCSLQRLQRFLNRGLGSQRHVHESL